MPNLLKKLAISFLSFLILFSSIAPNFLLVNAQVTATGKAGAVNQTAPAPTEGNWYNQGFDVWYNKVYDENTSPGSEIFGERYTAAQVQWVVYSLMAFILNASLGNSSESQKAVACFLTNSGDINTCISTLKGLITSLTPPENIAQNRGENKNLLSLVFKDRPFSGISYVR